MPTMLAAGRHIKISHTGLGHVRAAASTEDDGPDDLLVEHDQVDAALGPT